MLELAGAPNYVSIVWRNLDDMNPRVLAAERLNAGSYTLRRTVE
jgi:hypothetical protein